jgi:hypothetical protein
MRTRTIASSVVAAAILTVSLVELAPQLGHEPPRAALPGASTAEDVSRQTQANASIALARRGSPLPMIARGLQDDEEHRDRLARPAYPPDSVRAGEVISNLKDNTSLGDWRAIGPSNFGGKVYSIAIDPRNSNNVFVAYEVGGLWGTHNAGQTWTPMFDGFQNIAFSSVRAHPDVAGMVVAGLIARGGGYSISRNANVGIALSMNSGTSWQPIGPDADATASVWELGFGDTAGQVIYAPTDKGLYKTNNRGKSWTKILAYSGPDFFHDRPSFAVNPANSDVLLLAQATVGVMRSTDAGITWKRVDTWVNPAGVKEKQNPTILACPRLTRTTFTRMPTNWAAPRCPTPAGSGP